jgi:hypothetical protein
VPGIGEVLVRELTAVTIDECQWPLVSAQ